MLVFHIFYRLLADRARLAVRSGRSSGTPDHMTAEFNAGAATTPRFPSRRKRYAHYCLHKYLEQLIPNPGTSPIPQRDSQPGGLRATPEPHDVGVTAS